MIAIDDIDGNIQWVAPSAVIRVSVGTDSDAKTMQRSHRSTVHLSDGTYIKCSLHVEAIVKRVSEALK